MKKYFLSIVLAFLFIFSTNVFAATINTVEIINLDYPKLGQVADINVGVRGIQCSISKVIWYKDNVKLSNNIFSEEGKYTCKVYLVENYGYTISPGLTGVVANTEERTLGLDADGYYAELTYYVRKEIPEQPKGIYFFNMEKPGVGKTFDYEITSNYPDYYEASKIEWYDSNKNILSKGEKIKSGVYYCRVHINLHNGFEIKSKMAAQINGETAEKIVKDYSGTYFEVKYIVGEVKDPKCVTELHLRIDETPYYGQALKNVNVIKKYNSDYYDISRVEWYCNNYRMLDAYFYEGVYKCRIFIKFVNGGYPSSDMVVYTRDWLLPKKCSFMGNEHYVEETFTIKKYVISTMKFEGLNIPEYGSIQDLKVNSLEPGIYSPSMVYWYNDGKYMSNIESFGEGKYTCKFSINLNVDCEMASKISATINGESALVYMENGKLTIEKTYELKKPTKKWSKASEWAIPELEDALNYALIPTSLENKDFTKNITRAEFAAVAVRMYESITMNAAEPINQNPFSDTNDPEILKAYKLGITNGTSATTFEPNSLITRQEMATMMVRALEEAGISTSVNLNNVKKFADHNKIDSWALNGVYFMSNIGIIKGKGNNVFDVLGNATKEEALAISIRSVNYYK